MADYFDSVQAQLSTLCERRGRSRRRPPLRWPRLTPSLAVVVISTMLTVAVFAVAVAELSTRGHGSAPTRPATTTAPDTAAQRAVSMLDGIPQSGTKLGDPHAPVTITLFADLQCPVCRDFTLGATFRTLLAQQVHSGRVSVQFRSYCTTTCATGNQGEFDAQQTAAYAAAGQNRFWDYALLFFASQRSGAGRVTAAYLEDLARRVPGLSLARWSDARGARALRARLRNDAADARGDHVLATPTLVIASAGANVTVPARVTLIGAVSSRQLLSAIDRVQRARPDAIVQACLSTGRLTRRYSRAQLRAALSSMSAAAKRDTNCPDVIGRALRRAT